MNRALVSSQCWSCILKQSTGAGSRSSRSSRSSSSRSKSGSRTILESVNGRCLYSSSSNSNSVSDEAVSQSGDSNYKSHEDSFPSSFTSSKLKGKQKQTQLDPLSDEPDSQSSIPPSDSDWDLFSSDSFFNPENHHSDPNPSSDPPISSPSPPSTQVSRQVLFSPDSTFYQNQFPSFSNQSQRTEILRRRRNEKERIGNHSNEMTSSGNGRKSNQYRAPLTEPEADRFRKVFDLINDQETVIDDDRRKLNGEIGNAIQLVEGLKGKGNGKLDLDFRNSSRFSKKDGNLKNEELDYLDRNLGGESQAKEEEIGQRFRSSDDDKEIKTKSVNETLDEILRNVRYSEDSKSDQGKRGRNQEASIGSHYLNPIAGNESLQGFRNRNRLNRFQNQIQIQRRPQSIDEEDQEVHEKSFSRTSGLSVEKDAQEATRRVEFEKNLAEIKDEIDSIKDLNQVWDWFSERVLRTSKENDGLDRDSSNPNQETFTPCGIQTSYFSPILIHLFQAFKTKFNSPESSITLYEIVKSHSVESLIMSSSIPFFNLVLKTFWLDFRDYRECLKVLEVAQMVGVLDLEKDPSLEREDAFDERNVEDEQQKFGDESIRETVELIRNEIRQEVLSKIELNKANPNKSQEYSIPFNLRAESNPTDNTSDPDPSLGFPIPTSLFKSIKSEFDFTSLESSEKLKVVHQMGLIVGKPFRVSSRISRDSSRSSTSSSKTNQLKSRELTQYEDEFREEKRKRLVEKLEERRLEKERKKDLGRKKNLAKVKVRSHSSRFSEKEIDSYQGGRWEKDEDSYQGGRW